MSENLIQYRRDGSVWDTRQDGLDVERLTLALEISDEPRTARLP